MAYSVRAQSTRVIMYKWCAPSLEVRISRISVVALHGGLVVDSIGGHARGRQGGGSEMSSGGVDFALSGGWSKLCSREGNEF